MPEKAETASSYTYIYRRYRRCGNRLLDAHAYGLKAWRLKIRIKEEAKP
jgi:hypothetical protein